MSPLQGICVSIKRYHTTGKGRFGRGGALLLYSMEHIQQEEEKGYLRYGTSYRYDGGSQYYGCS